MMDKMPFHVPMSIFVICTNAQTFFKVYKERLGSHHESAYEIGRSLPYRVSEAVMVEIQARKSQKAEDKYFAVLGLIGGSRTSNLPVDSEQDLKLVYHDLFVTLLEYTGSLNILLFASRKRFTDSPSWVIDWTDAPRCWIRARYYSRMLNGFESRRSPQVRLEEYAGATLESESIWEYRSNKQQLAVRGKIIGMLAWCSNEFKELDQSSSDSDLLLNVAYFRTLMSILIPLAQEKTAEGLCRFFEACSDRYQGRPSSDEWRQIMRQNASQNTETVWEQLKQQRDSNSTSTTTGLAWKYHIAITKFLADEKMVLVCSCTASGNPVSGVSPIGAEVGDIVTLISGVSTPMILRRDPDSHDFQVVGPAFLPGVMDGELWDEGQLSELLKF